MGDFLQYPPVGGEDLAIFTNIDKLEQSLQAASNVLHTALAKGDERKAEKASKSVERFKRAINGKHLWHKINKVVFLTKQHRCKDQEYLRLLRSMRCAEGSAHNADITNIVQDRVLNQGHTRLDEPSFEEALYIFTRNEQAMMVNNLKVKDIARRTGQRVLVSPARERHPDTATESDIQRVRGLPFTRSARMPGYLPLIIGMKAFRTTTEAKSHTIGLVNMAPCEVTRIVLDENEPKFSSDPDLPPHFLKYPPKAVYVKMTGERIKDNPAILGNPMPGFQKDEVPINRIQKKYKPFGPDNDYSVIRAQVPISPAYACTSYACQVI
jgi:hypothetical protein